MNRRIEFIVPLDRDGISVERFLRGSCNVSARLLPKLKRIPMGITCNGVHIRTIDKVHAGDVIRLLLPVDDRSVEPVELPIDIVYEDEDIVVLNKPSGMPVHPTHGHTRDTLANAYAAYRMSKGEYGIFRPVNRLDRDTTGLLLACKNSHSASVLNGRADKVYYAVCQGVLEGSGTIDAPLRRKEGYGIMREVGEGGKRCITHWTALCSRDGLTLLEILLETGRTHQIRAHFSSYMKMPLAGDDMYGGSHELIARQALHCGEMSFTHPVTGERICIRKAPPDDFLALSVCERFEERF